MIPSSRHAASSSKECLPASLPKRDTSIFARRFLYQRMPPSQISKILLWCFHMLHGITIWRRSFGHPPPPPAPTFYNTSQTFASVARRGIIRTRLWHTHVPQCLQSLLTDGETSLKTRLGRLPPTCHPGWWWSMRCCPPRGHVNTDVWKKQEMGPLYFP